MLGQTFTMEPLAMQPPLQPLWQPSSERINSSHMARFTRGVETKLGLQFSGYDELHRWSVEHPEQFWQWLWNDLEIISSRGCGRVLTDADQFPGARWFAGARLNFAENLLRNRSQKTALVARLENGSRRVMSYAQLFEQVAQLAAALRRSGVVKGDRVAGFMPNVPEAVVAMLASSSIGAIWSSCSPDFGINGVIDRFGQIEPKVLFACDGYYYNGKTLDTSERVGEICRQIPSIRQRVIVPIIGVGTAIPDALDYADFLLTDNTPPLEFEQLPFDHPLYIVYSSGTTGVPKCIVHGAGGTLLQQLKEHRLHVDLRSDDVLFYFTTCGWMMWNWLVAGLASEATLVLYDGAPFFPSSSAMMDMVDGEQISVFGTSAKYIDALQKSAVTPRSSNRLDHLRLILSTGSPLSHESFRYVYRDIKTDICLSSISGGTDILSCFVLGNPTTPVWEGEIQCRGLGMAVEIWDPSGRAVREQKGELVCVRPFPSAPIGFWNDPQGKKYHDAYFAAYPNVWAHGDYAEITAQGGVVIHGRSDAALNPGGVRIGTAEIYRQVAKLDAVLDSLCIGQEWQGDVRVVLFVVLRDAIELDDALVRSIREVIRRDTTPRHVPAKVIAVTDIPRTLSGKIVELAVRNTVHGRAVTNRDALANPEALALFKDLPALMF